MANYISTDNLLNTINDLLATTNRAVVILPFDMVAQKTLFSEWLISPNDTLDFCLVLTGTIGEAKLKARSIEQILGLKSIKIFHHEGQIISRILTNNQSLLLPNGIMQHQSEKAGVLSNLGIDHQDDLTHIQTRSKLIFHKKPQYKTKFFGLQKSFERSHIVEDALGLVSSDHS